MGKTKVELNGKSILVTGSPGFIGAYLVLRLLKELNDGTVVSLDNMNDYYDPALKEYRLRLIEKVAESSSMKHVFLRGSIADKELVGMQPGDVPITYADSEALERDYGFTPKIGIREGLRSFAEWYAEYHK